MAAISTVVRCPAGQWTSIAQYMPSRNQLMVQCPQNEINGGNVTKIILNGGGSSVLVSADLLRSKMWIGTGPLPAGSIHCAAFQHEIGIGHAEESLDNSRAAFINYDNWGWPSVGAWDIYCTGDGASNVEIKANWDSYTCAGLVLGIQKTLLTQNTRYNPSLFTLTPVGIWLFNTEFGGGETFRVDRINDYDLVIQEWFAWPAGSGTVNVQVFQSFDEPINFPSLTVQIPGLSPYGKKAAQDLIAAMQRQNNELDFVNEANEN